MSSLYQEKFHCVLSHLFRFRYQLHHNCARNWEETIVLPYQLNGLRVIYRTALMLTTCKLCIITFCDREHTKAAYKSSLGTTKFYYLAYVGFLEHSISSVSVKLTQRNGKKWFCITHRSSRRAYWCNQQQFKLLGVHLYYITNYSR